MLLLRLLQWALRRPVLPAGHLPGCRAGLAARPGEPSVLVDTLGVRIVPPEACRCDYHGRRRPPTRGEALTGLSGT